MSLTWLRFMLPLAWTKTVPPLDDLVVDDGSSGPRQESLECRVTHSPANHV